MLLEYQKNNTLNRSDGIGISIMIILVVLGCPWKLVTIVSKLGYNLFGGLTTYLYSGYNLRSY